MAYSFKHQLAIGQHFEDKLDKWFIKAKKYSAIYQVDLTTQKMGIDRFAIDQHGFKHSLEYKTDLKAHQTENLFLETEVDGKPGWIHKCIANHVYIYIPPRGLLLHFNMGGIRSLLLDHSNQPEKVVYNEGFQAKGIIVPLKISMKYTITNYKRLVLEVNDKEIDRIKEEAKNA
jgi:hypothetical protein